MKLVYKFKPRDRKQLFINKYCTIINSTNELMPKSPWIVVIMNNCYITSSTSLDKILSEKDTIDFLLDNGITEVGSSFNKDKEHQYPVANIGFNPTTERWYGWSHRAFKSFGIGDECVELYPSGTIEGDIITNLDDAKRAAIKFAESVS